MIDEKEFSTDIAKVLNLDLKAEKPGNGAKKELTLTERLDELIEALEQRKRWAIAIRSTL